MKNLLFTLLLISSYVATGQVSLALLPNVTAASVNDVATAKTGLAAQLNLEDPEHLLRFQFSYVSSWNDLEVLQLQEFTLDAMAGSRAFDWLNFMLGFQLANERQDFDGLDRLTRKKRWILEPYFTAAIEANVKALQLHFYYRAGVDTYTDFGLRIGYCINIK